MAILIELAVGSTSSAWSKYFCPVVRLLEGCTEWVTRISSFLEGDSRTERQCISGPPACHLGQKDRWATPLLKEMTYAQNDSEHSVPGFGRNAGDGRTKSRSR